MTPFVDGNRDAVEHRSLAVSSFGGGNHVGGEVVEAGSSRGEGALFNGARARGHGSAPRIGSSE